MNRKELHEEWHRRLVELGCIWEHDGNPERPYALLTSGKRSNGFVNLSKLIQSPHLVDEMITYLRGLVVPDAFDQSDVFVGSAMGAVTIAHTYALDQLPIRKQFGFTEKQDEDMVLFRFEFEPGAIVGVCEDVITTGGTTRKTIKTLKDKGYQVNPFGIVCFVNRSGKDNLDGIPIHSLVQVEYQTWEEGRCPFTSDGTEPVSPVRPKGEGWYALNASFA